MELKLLLVLVLVAGTQAGPIESVKDACSRICTGTNKFGYKPGMAYEFDYNSKTSTLLKGASEGLSGLELTAKVHIEVISKCDFLLRIDNVQLHETNPNAYEQMMISAGSEELRRVLEHHNLRFSFQDGVVDELCPASGESTWALNIKRAILSVFQNSMDDLSRDQKVKESDVTGNCDVDYTVSESGRYSRIVKKSKNLLGCTERQGYSTSISGTAYRVPSDIQSLPLVKSDHNCQQEITTERQLKTASCVETHVFRPFSRENSGAVTESKQTLNFVRQRVASAPVGSVTKRSGMVFEHSYDSDKTTHSRVDVEKKLIEICENTRKDVRPNTPQLFTELVYLMRTVDAPSMKSVYSLINKKALCRDNQRIRKFFLDAIPMVGTSASLNLLTEFINDKTVTGVEADMWLTTLSFIQHPTKAMLKEVLPLLRENNGKAMLSVASLVNSYCKEASCENDVDVRNIISALQSKIGSGCYVNDNKLKTVVMSLRAIGNAGHAVRAIPTINSCITKRDNPMVVRLAAVEAFRRMPCNGDRSELMSLYMNNEEDSELRIAAYLALMECADEPVLYRVRETLQREEVNQVGSFVWSHLTNLMETSNPHKQEIRSILDDEVLRKDFDLDKRKFSRNYEGSFFLEKLNTGASVESNLIWSSGSFIPRSASANLTVDLFGQSVNLIEIGGRVEGLEYFLESYFGPNGYFGENDDTDATEQSVKGISSRKMKNIDRQFSSAMDELKGALYMRVFGNELGYEMFGGKETMFGGDSNILQLLITLSKNNDYSFTQSMMFMDSSIIVPTSSGFPMNLTINGTATIDIKASGKFDVRKLATSPRSVSIDGSIEPSAAVQISSMMSVDAFVTKSGLKMVSTLHTSTALQGRIELQNGRIFSSELDIPRQKMELFDFKTTFFTIHKDTEKEQQMITENRQTETLCSGSKLAKAVGLELCAELSFPNASLKADAPYFPLTGPVSMGVELVKRDTHDKYKLESRFTKSSDNNVMRVLFDTPGSKVNRKMEVDVTLDKVQKSLNMALTSPWKTAALSGSIKNEQNLKQFQGSFVIDAEPKVAILAEVKKSRKGASYVYTPTFEVKIPQKPTISLSGSLEYQALKLYDLDLTLAGLTKEHIIVKGHFQNKKVITVVEGSVSLQKGKTYSAEARLQKSFTKKAVNLKPFLLVRSPTKDLIAFGGSVIYKVQKSIIVDLSLSKIVSKDIKIFAMIRNLGNAKSVRYATKVNIKTPILFTKLRGSLSVRGAKNAIIKAQCDYIIPRVMRDSIILNGKMNFASTKSLKKVKGNLKMDLKKRPQYSFDFIVDGNNNQKKTEMDAALRYGANKADKTKNIKLTTRVTHRLSWTDPILALNSQFQHPGYGINVQIRGKHSHDKRQLDNDLALISGNSEKLSTSLTLRNKLKQKSGNLKIVYPGRTIRISNQFTQNNNGEYSNTLNTQYQPGKKNVIITTYRQPTKKSISASMDINLSDMKRVRLSGDFDLDINNLTSTTAIMLGRERYSVTTSARMNGPKKSIASDIEWPSRRVTIETEMKAASPVFMGRADIKWDASNDMTKSISLDGQANIESIDNFDANVNQRSPLGNLRLTLKHRGGVKYITNAAAEWGNSKRISVDTTFSHKTQSSTSRVAAKIKVLTPFKGYRNIDMDATHQSNKNEISTDIAVNWKPIKPIQVSLNLKKPIGPSYFVGSLAVKSPIRNFERTTFEIAHSCEGDLQAMTKFTWNKEFLQLKINGVNKGSLETTDLSGGLDWKSTVDGYEALSISGKHKSNGVTYENALRLTRNGKGVSYEGQVTHSRVGWQVQNNGRVLVTLPDTRLSTTWNHRNTNADITTSLTSNLGSHNLEVTLRATQDLTMERGTASSDFLVKSSFLPELNIAASHEHRRGMFDNNVNVQREGENILSLRNKYDRVNGLAKSSHIFETYGHTYSANTESQYDRSPYTGKLTLQWAPEKTLMFNADLGSVDGLYHGNMNIRSPFTPLENIIWTLQQSKNRKTTTTTSSLQYEPGKTINVETTCRWDRTKQIYLEVTTPFSSLRSMKTGGEFSGNMKTFYGKAEVEIQPILSKVAVSSQWSMIGGILGNMQITTPFPSLPYSKVEISSKTERGNQNTDFIIEYQPTKVIKLQNSYRYNPEDMMGSIVITTPFEKIPRIAATSTFTGNANNFRSNVRFDDTKNRLYEVDMNFSNGRQMTGELTIKSPLSDDIVASFNHEAQNSQYKTHGELQYQTGRKFEVDITGNGNEKYEGNMIIKSPLWDDLIASVHHSGDLRRFESRADMQYGKKRSEFSANFANDQNLEGSVMLNSPYTKRMTASMSHTGHAKQFQSRAEIEYQPGEKITTIATFNNVDKTEGTLQLTTPFWRSVVASFNHKGNLRNFKTSAKVERSDGQAIAIDGKLITKGKIEGTLKLQTPFAEDILATIHHLQEAKRLQSHAMLQYHPGKKIEGDLKFNYGKRMDGSLDLSTPFTKPFTSSFNYMRNAANIASQAKLQYGSAKKLELEVSLKNGKKKVGSFSLKTPYMNDVMASFNHFENKGQYVTHAEMQFEPNKKYEVDVSFGNQKQTKAALTLKTPHWNNIKAAFSHRGRISKFKTNFNLLYGQKQRITSDVRFQLNPTAELIIQMSTPFKGYSKLRFSGTHKGSLDSFIVKTMMARGKTAITGNLEFENKPIMRGGISIITPFAGYRELKAAFSHNGTLSAFQSRADVTYGKGKDLVLDLQYSLLPFTATLMAKTPLRGYESMSASVTHKGNMNKFRCTAELVNKKKRITATARLDARDSITAEIEMQTPMKGYEKLAAGLSHTGSLQRFNTQAEISRGRKKIAGEIIFNNQNALSASATLQTPFRNYRLSKMAFTNDGTLNNLRSHAEVQFMNEKSQADLTFSNLNSMEGAFTVNSPYISDIKTSMSYSRSSRRLNSHVNAQYGTREIFDGQISCNTVPTKSASASVKTAWTKLAEIQLSHEGSLWNFHTSGSAAYGGSKVEVDSTLDTSNDMLGSVVIKTPFTGMESLQASMSHVGRSTDFKTHLESSVNNEKIETDISFNSLGRKEGRITLKTPFQSIREMQGSVIVSSESIEIQVTKDGQTIQAESSLSTTDGINGRAYLQTPWTNDIIAVVRHTGSLQKFSSSADITYSGKKQISTDISFESTPSIILTSSLVTSCQLLRNIQATVRHDGLVPNFNTFAELNVNGEITSAQVNLQSNNGVDGKVILKTPYTSDLLVTLTTDGEPKVMRTVTEILYNNVRKVSFNTQWDLVSQMDGTISLKTSLEGYEDIAATFNLVGDRTNFRTNALLSYYQGQKIAASAHFNQGENQQGSLEFQSPYTSDFKASFINRGTDRLNLVVDILYDGQEKLHSEVTFIPEKDIESTVMLRSVVSGLENINAAFKHRNYRKSITSEVQLTINGLTYVADATLLTGSKKGMSFNLRTPHTENMSGTFSLHNPRTAIFSSFDMSYGNERVTGEMKGSWRNAYEASFKTNALSLVIDIGEVEGKCSYSGDWNQMQSSAELSLSPTEKFTFELNFSQERGILRITTPLNGYEDLSVGFRNTGSSERRVCNADFTYAGGKKIEVALSITNENVKEVTLSIKTPFTDYESMSSSFRYESVAGGFSLTAQIIDPKGQKMELDSQLTTSNGVDGRMTVKTPFVGFEEMSSSFRNQWTQDDLSTHAEMTYNKGEKIEGDLTFSSNDGYTAAVSIRTPYDGFTDLAAFFNHKNTRNSLTSQANIQYATGKKMELLASLKKGTRIHGEISLKTPFTGYEESKLSFSHLWINGRLQSSMELECVEKIEGSIELATSDPVKLHLTLKTPFAGYELSDLQASLISSPTGLKSNAAFQVNNEKINIDVTVVLKPRVEANVILQTPYSGWETTSFSLRHAGELANHQSSVELLYGSQHRIVASNYLKTSNGLEGRVSLTTPFTNFENTESSFRVNGNDGHAEVVYGNQQKIEGDVSFQATDRVEGSITIKTPFSSLENTAASFRVNGNDGHAEVVYGNQQKIECDISFEATDRVQGSIIIKTPFSNYESLQSSFNFEKSDTGLNSHFEMSKNDRIVRGELHIALADRSASGGVTLTTPFEHFESMSSNFNIMGQMENAQGNLNVIYRNEKVLAVTLKHIMASLKFHDAVAISSTYFEDITASIDHRGDISFFTSTASMSFGSDSIVQSMVSRINGNQIEISSDTTTTISGRRYVTKTAFEHEGELNNFKTKFLHEFNGRQDMLLEVSLKNMAAVEGSLLLKTPFKQLRNINVAFDHTGDLSQFKTNGFLRYSSRKQIEGTVDFFRYRLSRINANFELKTPFEGYELTKVMVRHNINTNGLKCMADIVYGENQRMNAMLKASKSPMSFEMAAQSPFKGFEEMFLRTKYMNKGNSRNIDANVKYAAGKEIIFHSSVLESNPISLTITLTTPFKGYENTELTYTHSGNAQKFQCNAEFHGSYVSSISGTLSYRAVSLSDMQIAASFSSPFENFETLAFQIRNQKDRDEIQSHSEASWTATDKIVVDVSFASVDNWNGNTINSGISMTTPFQSLRTLSLTTRHQFASSKYTETVVAELNSNKLLDMEIELGMEPSYVASLVMREPQSMTYALNGMSSDRSLSGDVSLNWNTEEPNSNIRVELVRNNDDASLRFVHPTKTVEVTGSLSETPYRLLASGDIAVDGLKAMGLEYELTSKNRRYNKEQANKLKVRLPSRSIQLDGIVSDNYGTKSVQGAFLWDADNDETKKIGVRANMMPRGPSTKADLSFSFPSIGKDVKLDSEMILNQDNVLFDGKTEFKYSEDVSKNLIIHSRVEDMSSGSRKNISLTLGLTHQYSTLDVQMVSHVAHVADKYTAGIDLQYMTAQRNKRNVRLMGEIDSLRKQIDLDFATPIKSMHLTGDITTDAPYRLSVRNLYDEMPVASVLTVDPRNPSLDLNLNYDKENPNNGLHIRAGYVNNNVIQAELYRQERSEKKTDALLAVRLNTSRIMHTRLHWNPSMIMEMKNAGLRTIESNSRRMDATLMDVANFVSEELMFKYNTIRRELFEETLPYVEMVKQNIESLRRDVVAAQRKVREIGQQYLLSLNYCENLLQEISLLCSSLITKANTISTELTASSKAWVPFPMKDEYDLYVRGASELMTIMNRESKQYYGKILDHIDQKVGELSITVVDGLSNYHKRVSDMISKTSNVQAIELLKSKYNQYLEQVNKIPVSRYVNDMANQYTSALYGARERINNGLSGILNTPANHVYQLGSAAYKFWEVEENTKALMRSAYNYIIEIIDEEIEMIKQAVTHLKSSKVTVYDPTHGEIQMDTYLPVPMPSLRSLPRVDITRHLNRMKSYLPDISKICLSDYLPDSDLAKNFPPFKATAAISGNTFTTFDGKTYDFNGRCSYVLAKDFVDGNFSAILSNIGRQKRKLVLTTATQSVQVLPNGKVRVGKSLVKLPYKSEYVSIVQEGNLVIARGRGFTVIYDVPNDTYHFTLSGWFYGKTGGLLGTFDNEQYNDIMTSSSRRVLDINDFADTWEVDEKCSR